MRFQFAKTIAVDDPETGDRISKRAGSSADFLDAGQLSSCLHTGAVVDLEAEPVDDTPADPGPADEPIDETPKPEPKPKGKKAKR